MKRLLALSSLGAAMVVLPAAPVLAEDFECTAATPVVVRLNQNVQVPEDEVCFVDADINGNVFVHGGTLVVLPGRTINGNIELLGSDPVANVQNATVRGNIIGKAKAQLELSGATIRSDVIFEKPTSGLEISNGPSTSFGNLEFKAATNVTGAGSATVHGNIKCNNNVTDLHAGVITGKKENCPPTF